MVLTATATLTSVILTIQANANSFASFEAKAHKPNLPAAEESYEQRRRTCRQRKSLKGGIFVTLENVVHYQFQNQSFEVSNLDNVLFCAFFL